MTERAFDAEVRDAFATYWQPPSTPALDDDRPIWTPLAPEPGRGILQADGRLISPQQMAYESLADELFYGGAAGCGKSELELGLALTAHHNSVIFRTEFAQFRGADALIERSKEVIGTRGRLNESTYQWRGLPGGRAFEFAGVNSEKALGKWKGRPHDLKAFDEITEFAEPWYRFLIAWLRTAIVGQRTRVVCTGNPPTTAAGQWVVKYWGPWLDKTHPHPAAPGELRWFATINGKDVELPSADPVPDGKGQLVTPRSRTFIPGRVEDNPYYMRTGYADVLNSLPEPLRSQLRFGDFEATQDDDAFQVIPTASVRAAQRRWREQPKPAGLALTTVGNDPSRGGQDKFCVAKRYGFWVAPVIRHAGREAPDGASGVRLIVQAIVGEQPQAINIDIGGSAGSSVFDHAREVGLPAVALNGAEASKSMDRSGTLRFFNKRAEWYWTMREVLDPGSGQDIALPDDPELLADLCASRWRITPRGIRIEEKADVKQRLGRSPDVGEAVIYAFAQPTDGGLGFLAWATQELAAQAAQQTAAAPQPTATPATVSPARCVCGAAGIVERSNGVRCCSSCGRVREGLTSPEEDNPWMHAMKEKA